MLKYPSTKCLPKKHLSRYCSTATFEEDSNNLKRLPSFGIYKPNTNEAIGAAMQIHFDASKKCCFFHAAKQMGPKAPPGSTKEQFDWKNKVVLKISVQEMGKILSFLNGKSDNVDLIHKVDKFGTISTSTLKLKKGQNEGTYGLQITRQTGTEKALVSIYFDNSEHAVIEK